MLQSLHWKQRSTTSSTSSGLSLLESTSANSSSVQYESMASNSFGKLPQNFTHSRHSAQRWKTRSTSERRSFSSQNRASVRS